MALVITEGCCSDAACVAVCPVQCIRPRPGDPDFTTAEQLYIDPAACIDCGACAAECPVDAIHPAEALPTELTDYRAVNAEYFAKHPLGDTRPLPLERRRLPRERPRLRVAIVGAGPAGLYAAAELSELRGVEVTFLDRLPTPYGLVRAGVAPDHDRTKTIGERFDWVLRRHNVTCLFNVEVGRDVTVDELLEHHHAVIYASGAPGDRALRIPGESLSVPAREFVAWYNGHPDFAARRFDLSGRRAVVVGNGNVALDVARVLARPVEAYEKTAMADHALDALRASAVREVVVAARRGPAFAAYSTAELIALSRLPDVDLLAEPTEVAGLREIDDGSPTFQRRAALVEQAAQRVPSKPRRIVLRYGLTPARLLGGDTVSGLELTRPDGTTERLDTSLVVRAIGFRGRPVPGLPFDEVSGTIPHRAGRVVDPTTGDPLPGLYCSGWIKRGPTGVIGTNRTDSAETVRSLLADVQRGNLLEPPHDITRFVELLRHRCPDSVDADGWQRIDAAERDAGRPSGRPRVTLVTTEELVTASTQPQPH